MPKEEGPRGTEEKPVYLKWKATEGTFTDLYMVAVDEGWRQSVLCSGMYEWAADWLIEQLQGKPFAPEHRWPRSGSPL